MNKQQFVLFISTMLVVSATYAQSLQFNNGDTLDVKLIRQTGSTLSFFHPALGEMTIDKNLISNVQDLNLATLEKVAEGEEGKGVIAAQIAQEKMLLAKQGVDSAYDKLIAAEAAFKTAKPTELNAAHAAIAEASALHKKAEENLVTAVGAVHDADQKVGMAKDIRLATEQVDLAKADVKNTSEQVIAAKKGVTTSLKQADVAKQELDNAAPASIAIAEENIEVAKKQLEIAEQKVVVAEGLATEAQEKVVVAENQVKRAKGEKVNDGFMGTGWFKDWDSSIELGLRGSSGQSNNANFRTAFNALYEDDAHRWKFKSFYIIDSEDDVVGENKANATLVKDWFFPETKWFAFAAGTYDWDQFRDWKHRLQFSVGPGYQFIKTDRWEFSGRVGGTAVLEIDKRIEDVGTPVGYREENVWGFEALIGVDLTWHITAKQQFTFSNYFYPSVTDSGHFRNLTNIDWKHDIDWFEGLAIKFNIRNEYDTSESIPNDFNYNFSILWGF